MWPMGTFNDPWILDSSVWSSIELHSSIFSSVRSGWRKSTIEQLGEDSQPGLSRMGAEDIYLVDLVVERCCNILNSKRSSSTSEEMKMIEEDMWEIWTEWPRMSQWIQDLWSNHSAALRMLSIPRLSFPWASLSGSEIQSNLAWPDHIWPLNPNPIVVDRILNCEPY